MLKGPLRDRHLSPSRQDPQHASATSIPTPGSRWMSSEPERKELGDWPDWCFLPLAGTYAIVSKGKTLQSPNQAHHIGILGALAAWRVTQGIYRFDPTTFDALWKTPVTGDIPTEVLFHLPEWCVYIPTPDQTWQGANPQRVLRPPRIRHERSANRASPRAGRDRSGRRRIDRHADPPGQRRGCRGRGSHVEGSRPPVPRQDANTGGRGGDSSPATFRPWSRWSSTSAPKPPRSGRSVPGSVFPAVPKPQKTKKGMRIFAPDHPSRWEVGYRLGAALRQALSEHEPAEPTGTHASPRPHIRRAHWHSFWVGQEGSARCQVRDAQVAAADPGQCAGRRGSDDDGAGCRQSRLNRQTWAGGASPPHQATRSRNPRCHCSGP